ncbi:MAG: cache domain-containing sensor histidine kinase [Christensenellales bacterium]|jgi:two-component system sensor histidine kinase YesM
MNKHTLLQRLINRWSNLRISRRMLLSYSIAVIIPMVLINAWTFVMTHTFSTSAVSKTIDTTLSEANGAINAHLNSLYERAVIMSNVPELASLLDERKVASSGPSGVPTLRLSETLSALSVIYETGPSYYYEFYAERDNLSYHSGNLIITSSAPHRHLDWYKAASEFIGGVYWRDIHNNSDFGFNRTFVTACRPIYSEDKRLLGILTVSLDFSHIQHTISTLLEPNRGSVFLYDAHNSLIYSSSLPSDVRPSSEQSSLVLPPPVMQHLFSQSSGSGTHADHIYNFTTIDQLMAKLITIMPLEQFFGAMNNIWNFLFPVLLTSVILFLIVTNQLSKSLTRPLHILIRSMRSPTRLPFPKYYAKRDDEIGDLTRAYMHMTKSNQMLIQETREINEKKRSFQMEALQGQINSHFIYNTLNNIQWLAASGRTDDVISTATLLDRLLRACTKRQSELVTIEDELDYVDSYLSIQKIRFGNRFSYEFNLDPLLLQMKIPMFVLQPIVENSIYHGLLDGSNEHGIIRISISEHKGDIIISVFDNGKGVPAENLKYVLEQPADKNDIFMGIALRNINKRIKLSFGEKYGLKISSKQGEWTRVDMRIPKVEE